MSFIEELIVKVALYNMLNQLFSGVSIDELAVNSAQ
jgi:hypothetical protein